MPHKKWNLRSAYADFVAKGWKIINPISLEVVQPYDFGTFKRIPNLDPVQVFLKIFSEEFLEKHFEFVKEREKFNFHFYKYKKMHAAFEPTLEDLQKLYATDPQFLVLNAPQFCQSI